MKKIITSFVLPVFLFGLFGGVAYLSAGMARAETTTATTTAQELINQLKQQVQTLLAQIEQLKAQVESVKQIKTEVKTTAKEVKKTSLELKRQLRLGMSGEDIELLQEFLSTDSEIYPEGLKTGYFGPLTKRAVERFQKKMGVEQVGQVGPKTIAKINELLTEGAGNSGKIPPGLLVAPGIQKKLGFAPEPPSDQALPCGIAKKLGLPCTITDDDDDDDDSNNDDTTAPVISGISATEIASTSAKINWTTNEMASSKVWYSTETPVDTSTTTTLMTSNSTLTLTHEITISNLTASTTYYYVVSSTDEANNIATGEEKNFATLTE